MLNIFCGLFQENIYIFTPWKLKRKGNLRAASSHTRTRGCGARTRVKAVTQKHETPEKNEVASLPSYSF